MNTLTRYDLYYGYKIEMKKILTNIPSKSIYQNHYVEKPPRTDIEPEPLYSINNTSRSNTNVSTNLAPWPHKRLILFLCWVEKVRRRLLKPYIFYT